MTDHKINQSAKEQCQLRYSNQKYPLFDKIYRDAACNIPSSQSSSYLPPENPDGKVSFILGQGDSQSVMSVSNSLTSNDFSNISHDQKIAWVNDQNNNDLSSFSTSISRNNISSTSSINNPLPGHASINQRETRARSSKCVSVTSKSSTNDTASKHEIDPKCLPFYERPVSLYYEHLCSFHNYKHLEKFDEDYDEHPEDPRRVLEIFDSIIQNKDLVEKSYKPCPENPKRKIEFDNSKINIFQNISRFAKKEEILLGHTEEYYNQVQSFKYLTDSELYETAGKLDSLYLSRTTELAASVGLGTCLQAADDFIQNKNLQAAYCLTRPPGHHAYRHKGSGFCIYNNAAIVAKYVAKNAKFKRILILDWDIHHGNGTQDITKDDAHILFISMHRHDDGCYYPWLEPEMSSKFLGDEKARGININLPFSKRMVTENHDLSKYHACPTQATTTASGSKYLSASRNEMTDIDYFYVLENIVKPIIEAFEPQFTIISNGLDAGRGDPLGKYGVTPESGFSGMLHRILNYTSKQNSQVLLILEGGYNLTTLKIASNSMLEFLVKYYKDKRTMQQKHALIKNFTQVDIKSIKNSLLFDVQTIIKDILSTWKKKANVNEAFMKCLNQVADEINRRKAVIKKRDMESRDGESSQPASLSQSLQSESNRDSSGLSTSGAVASQNSSSPISSSSKNHTQNHNQNPNSSSSSKPTKPKLYQKPERALIRNYKNLRKSSENPNNLNIKIVDNNNNSQNQQNHSLKKERNRDSSGNSDTKDSYGEKQIKLNLTNEIMSLTETFSHNTIDED